MLVKPDVARTRGQNSNRAPIWTSRGVNRILLKPRSRDYQVEGLPALIRQTARAKGFVQSMRRLCSIE
jgi:hypothetical protein